MDRIIAAVIGAFSQTRPAAASWLLAKIAGEERSAHLSCTSHAWHVKLKRAATTMYMYMCWHRNMQFAVRTLDEA